ncbi:MAG: DNA polymerase subunit [Geobacteraceae bacterium]|nr:MAG: DNA polymerase subunit [Geobacteraceae bacterium]
MIAVTEAILKEMAEKIVAAVNPRMIILFGSHALGTARPDSDLDFIVVEDGPFGPERSRRAEMVKLWRLLREVRIAKDFLVFTPEEVEKWRDAPNHVVAHALREGRILYERH